MAKHVHLRRRCPSRTKEGGEHNPGHVAHKLDPGSIEGHFNGPPMGQIYQGPCQDGSP